ncbi:MAG: type I restriction enzyme HsdR N-terminal domain-containing protein [Bacteroidales bacterium]|nr:type I restriction enzyme HsdR N-terminal domain-containing protein [Bacteroidales bacterium]
MEWFKTRVTDTRQEIFDPLRRQYVALTPEEEVRQTILQQMVEHWHYPPGLIAVEYSFRLHKLRKRSDIVVFSKSGKPVMLIECKARHQQITSKVLDQAIRYNLALQVRYLVLSNADTTKNIKINPSTNQAEFLRHFPTYDEICRESNNSEN